MKVKLKIAVALVLMWTIVGYAGAADKSSSSQDNKLPALSHWLEVASAAQKAEVPIVVMVSLEGCGFCKVLRQSHLQPLHALEKSTPRAVVRQIEINGTQTLIAANGVTISHAKFAQNLGARVAPTVYFLNARGEQIAPPLEGGLLPDFYSAYLDDALEVATKKLRDSNGLK